MAARPATDDSRDGDSGESALRTAATNARVLSVSPRKTSVDLTPELEPVEILGQTARELIEQYRQSATRLSAIVEQGRECDRSAAKSMLHLQERLRLGARMLKAFQSEISRAEERLTRLSELQRNLHNADASIGAALRDVQSCLLDSLAKYQQQIESISNRAIEEFDRRIAERSGTLSDAPALRMRCD